MNFLKYKSNRYTVKEIKAFKPFGRIFLKHKVREKFFQTLSDKIIFFFSLEKDAAFDELTDNLQIARSFDGFSRLSHAAFIFHPKPGPI
jgi:hypothetical protein